MLNLTDNLTPSTGGFECVKGFHREFAAYYDGVSTSAGRAAPPNAQNSDGWNQIDLVCVGDFSPVRYAYKDCVFEKPNKKSLICWPISFSLFGIGLVCKQKNIKTYKEDEYFFLKYANHTTQARA